MKKENILLLNQDLSLTNGLKISGNKKRVHFNWNLNELFESKMNEFVDIEG